MKTSSDEPMVHWKRRALPLGVAALGAVLVASLGVRHLLAEEKPDARAPAAKPVTVVRAAARPFQRTQTFVGTLEPWLAANVGPQLISAYVDSVQVRPGALVKRGDLLATLDCRDASSGNRAASMEARAIDAHQKAIASESARLQDLLAQHFVSPNEAQMKAAASAAEAAKLEAQRAKLSRTSLAVADCVLRAPFDGEVATRAVDPGAFVRPGTSIVSLVDRTTVRFTADIPEVDFERVATGTPVRIFLLATQQELFGAIARRAPAADPSTRTVHFEVDLPDPAHRIPVGTTGEARIDIGASEPATAVPIAAATLRGDKASVFVLEGDVVRGHTFPLKGEGDGWLFLDPALAAGSEVVTDGRTLVADGDRVVAKTDDVAPPEAARGAQGAKSEEKR